MKNTFYIISLLFLLSCSSSEDINTPINAIDQEIYFPSNNNTNWETISPALLNWNETKLNDLYTFLDSKNTKGFIILHNGKIAVEKYFNGHSQTAYNKWYSTAKSLTATAIGVAQDEGLININNKTSDYLGNDWSNLTQEKQDLITVKHHLTMTTGLINNPINFVDWTCTDKICMKYHSDTGTNWAYHQGAFTQLQRMLSLNTGNSFEVYIKNKILDKIGASGSWNSTLSVNVFSSNTRSMARFGLLSLNKGKWNNQTIVTEAYFNEMTNTSQNLNKAYGYLWWLNGKNSFVSTGSSSIQGELIPAAPNDMFAALGKNDQKIYVVPSLKLVIIRCGESAGGSSLANSSFDNELWTKINEVIN